MTRMINVNKTTLDMVILVVSFRGLNFLKTLFFLFGLVLSDNVPTTPYGLNQLAIITSIDFIAQIFNVYIYDI